MECPHLVEDHGLIGRCAFIRNYRLKSETCDICIPQWKDGQPPQEDSLTPILIQITNKQPMPGLLTQAANLGKAVVKHVIGGLQESPPEEYSRRLSICQVCDKLEPKEKRCRECGCFVETKAKMLSESCPLGKWDQSATISLGGGCGCSK